MRPLLPLLLVATALSGLTGCVQLAEVDSTHAPRFASMLGREYELREELLVRGVKRDARSAAPDYVLVMPPPGIGGRFIVDLGTLPRGTRFRIVGVTTHRSRLFPSTRYVISLRDQAIADPADRDILITDTSSWDLYLAPSSPAEAPQLNPRFFRAL